MSETAAPTIASRIIRIVSEVTGEPEDRITLKSKFFVDIPMDSLDQIEIIMQIEDAFAIAVPEEQQDLATVGDVVQHVEAAIR